MTITLELNSDIEKSLIAQANERGVSLQDYLQEIIIREAGLSTVPQLATAAKNLSDLLLNSPFAGADLNLERHHDFPRHVEFE